MSEATATVRRAIHDGPSREDFARLAAAFDRMTGDETAQMVAFAAKHVDAWPAAIRVAPPSWWRRIAGGETVPAFQLARALELESPGGGHELMRAIAASPATRQLLHLSIRGEPLGDAGAAHLASSTRLVQLESLALIDAGLGPAGVRSLMQARLRGLERLDLSGNALTPESLVAVVGRPNQLAVARCELGAEGARKLAKAEQTERLWSLDLADNDIGDAGAGALSAADWMRGVSHLSLRANGITERGARALSRSSWIEGLSALDLSRNPIGEGGLVRLVARLGGIAELSVAGTGLKEGALAELLSLARLVELDASENRIGETVLARLGGIRRLSLRDVDLDASQAGALPFADLESLDLAGNALGLNTIAVLAGSTALSSLDLSRTGLGDSGLTLIARGRTMESLRSLGLANDGITPDGLAVLLESERTIRLASIDLSDNPLGPDGARRLADSVLISRLTRIRARNCGFTSDCIETLQASAQAARIDV